jgi:chromosome segregation ATPase
MDDLDAELIANSPTWLQQSIDMLEDQQTALKSSFKVGIDLAELNERLKSSLEQQDTEIERLELEVISRPSTDEYNATYAENERLKSSLEQQQRELEATQVSKSVLSAQLIDEIDRHAKVTAKYLRLSAESADKDREITRLKCENKLMRDLLNQIDGMNREFSPTLESYDYAEMLVDIKNDVSDVLESLSPNKEVSPPIDYKAYYEVIVRGLRDAINGSKTVDEVLGHMESTTGFTLYDCDKCYDEGEIYFEDGDRLNGGPCPKCQGGEVSTDERD